jgi:hypothetical protein
MTMPDALNSSQSTGSWRPASSSRSEEPIDIGERQRPEEHRVRNAEHGGVRPDAKGQGQHREQRIASVVVQQAQREPQVLQHVVPPPVHHQAAVSARRGRSITA